MREAYRKLAALMFTDIVGYTALAQRDESLALELLAEHNNLLREAFASYGGKEIKFTGDGFLVEFESPVQSVRCAMEIQSRCEKRNATGDRKRAFQVRIGIHLGDVVHQDDDVIGDGVNIASRIEPLAQPGGICITRQVHDQVWNKVSAEFESLGLKELKNLRIPVEVFRLTARAGTGRRFQQDRTRIAVLPLVNISPDPSDAYFADGMTDELIHTLSQIDDLKVIAQTSALSYRNTKKTIAQIGRELNIGTALEGSVRKAGDTVRITVQLVDVASEEHLWSEEYDRPLRDIFEIQSDVAQQVAGALRVRLAASTARRMNEAPTQNLEAYSLYLRGRSFLEKRKQAAIEEARDCFRRAIELDPDFAFAHTGLSGAYIHLVDYDFLDPKVGYPLAKAAAKRAIEIDATCREALLALACLLLVQDRDVPEAERAFRNLLAMYPGYASAHRVFGIILMSRGKFDEAVAEAQLAIELDPLDLVAQRNYAGLLAVQGQSDKAIAVLHDVLEVDPQASRVHEQLGECYFRKGMYEEALTEFGKETAYPTPALVGCVYAAMGKVDEARKILGQLVEQSRSEYVNPVDLAYLAFAIREDDLGFQCLEEAYELGSGRSLLDLKTSVWFESVRSDPRFISLLRRTGLEPSS